MAGYRRAKKTKPDKEEVAAARETKASSYLAAAAAERLLPGPVADATEPAAVAAAPAAERVPVASQAAFFAELAGEAESDMVRHQAPPPAPIPAHTLREVAPRDFPRDVAAARQLPVWVGFAAACDDLRELPRVGRIRVHAPYEDASVLFLVAADQARGAREMIPARAASIAEAEAILSAAGHGEERSVTRALCALSPIRRAQWLGLLRALGHELIMAPVLDSETALPPSAPQADVLCHASLTNHLPKRIVAVLSRIAREESLPEITRIASVGCRAGAMLPLSCSPAALSDNSGTVLLWTPMVSKRDGLQQSPERMARDILAYALRHLEASQTLHSVISLLPQAAPGRSHWARWWAVESPAVQEHCVGRVELLFAGQNWGAYVLTREARGAGTSTWVRARSPPQSTAPPARPPADDPEALRRWFLGGARRWVVVCDRQRLPSNSRRPLTQEVQSYVSRGLHLEWLGEAAVMPVGPLSDRFLTARLDLSGAAARIEEVREQRGQLRRPQGAGTNSGECSSAARRGTARQRGS